MPCSYFWTFAQCAASNRSLILLLVIFFVHSLSMMKILFFIKHFSWFIISITHLFLATELSKTLAKAYKDKNVFDYSVLEGQNKAFSWILYVDILILEVGGNLYDTVSIAVKAALHSTYELIACFDEFCNNKYTKQSQIFISLLFYEEHFFDWGQTVWKKMPM